ncbi:MAG TPA: hypothetical protein PLU52_04650 [Opitutaceae bacterium]|nr:hypothetical protein [Opitutaceae bacterium]HND61655.1 hypothetical protein [Opitutaceae bacterium]
MTLRTKTNLAGILAAVLGNLVVFSHILRIPDSVQWGLMLGVLLLLGVQFHYFKKLKEERAREISRGAVTVTSLADQHRQSRRKLIIIWICLIPFTLSMPRWLPYVSGVSLGRTGDMLVALVTLGLLSLIFWNNLRRTSRNRPKDPSQSGGTP